MTVNEVRVVHRNLRWEVEVDHVTRPIVDWFYSCERAVEQAKEEARRLGVRAVRVERWDGTLEASIALSGEDDAQLSRVA